jgi:hypothetical protein
MASSCATAGGVIPSRAEAGVAQARPAAMAAIANNEMRFMSVFPGSHDCDN